MRNEITIKKNQMKNNAFAGTYFPSVKSKNGVLMTLEEFIGIVKSDKYKELVRQYRIQKAAGNDKQASYLKSQSPVWVSAAQCVAGRKKENVTGVSMNATFDVDGVNPEWSAFHRDFLKDISCIAGANQTIGGGLRIIAHVGLVSPEEWKEKYMEVCDFLEALLDCKTDRNCNDITRCSFFSHDPNAWCRPAEECELFPFGNWQKLITNSQQTATEKPEENETSVVVKHETKLPDAPPAAKPAASTESESAPAASTGSGPATVVRRFTDEELLQLLERAVFHHPLIRGLRNANYMYIGRYAHRQGCTQSDLDALKRITAQRYSDKEYKYYDIASRLEWGYAHFEEKGKEVSKSPLVIKSNSHIYTSLTNDPNENIGNMPSDMLEPRLVEMKYRYIGEKRSIVLPSIFQDILKYVDLPFLKHVTLMTMIVAISSLLSKVYFNYKHNKYSANLFWILAAKAGGYKSMALISRRMLKDVFAKYEEINRRILLDHKAAQYNWEQEKRNAAKEGREIDTSKAPSPTPQYIMFDCPDNISKSQLIHNFANSEGVGMIEYIPELGSLISSLGADSGNFLAELCKAAMNEPIAQHYKTDGKPIRIEFPMLSFIGTSTFDVLVQLIPDTDNGFQSRPLYTILPDRKVFDGISEEDDDKEDELIDAIETLAPFALGLHEFFLKYPCEMKLDKNQKKRFNRFFKNHMDALSFEEVDGYSSVIVRSAINFLRICSVLSAIRKYQEGNMDSTMYCHDDDFDAAMEIIDISIEHSLAVISMMPINPKKLKAEKASCPHRVMDIMNNLSEQFSTNSFEQLAYTMYKMSKSSSTRSLRTMTERGYLNRIDKGLYQKSEKLKEYMINFKKEYFEEE